MKLSTAVSLFCASFVVLADAAAIPPRYAEDSGLATLPTVDLTGADGASHQITRDAGSSEDSEGSSGSSEDSGSDGSGSSSGDDSGSNSTSPSTGSGSAGTDGKTYSGTGTWFIPSTEGGSAGACGGDNEDDAQIVALNAEQYGDTDSESAWCGKKVEITSNGKTATATITDACPDCVTGDLDLTQAVFKQLNSDLDTGEIDITWKVVS
ncbi:hypothetical protein INT45_003241 [Circinella minor]|uniref:RlpA-like protein double-psi beta-barrel domain-containing protein n=1 Tax=Circinella minor TaxID=1195481 RepID=A0A8H7S9D7_9FUNG|nr:hypothetical protein INT45_003241 [Circinella minor]